MTPRVAEVSKGEIGDLRLETEVGNESELTRRSSHWRVGPFAPPFP